MNFDFNDDQRAIKRTAHDFLTARYPAATVRALAEADVDVLEALMPFGLRVRDVGTSVGRG